MNEFTIKKLAEVQAFNQLGGTIAKRGGEQLAQTAPDVAQQLRQAASLDLASSVPDDRWELFAAKTAKTTDKLTTMMELYVGDEWDNPVEVLEWSSFYAGAGAAHSALADTASGLTDATVSANLARQAEAYHELLQSVVDALRVAAANRAS